MIAQLFRNGRIAQDTTGFRQLGGIKVSFFVHSFCFRHHLSLLLVHSEKRTRLCLREVLRTTTTLSGCRTCLNCIHECHCNVVTEATLCQYVRLLSTSPNILDQHGMICTHLPHPPVKVHLVGLGHVSYSRCTTLPNHRE